MTSLPAVSIDAADPNDASAEDMVDFGYRQVPRSEKRNMVRDVFKSVAGRYDLMNDAMSLGVHRAWKRVFINELAPRPHLNLLDLAGGTGDISFGWLEKGGGRALLTDINPAMLEMGRGRAVDNGIYPDLDFCVVDAENIPLASESRDRVSMAFGLRNCTDKSAVLAEIFRVLRPGGRFLCLEFSKVENAALAPVYDAWSFKVLPKLGLMLASDSESYQYLAESIRMFPPQEDLKAMMEDVGFEKVSYRNLSAGIVAIHSGWRL